jgi:uncharacterized protein DUF1592/uncharacterized protein DUF1588/uncharacterized protein DUF1587/uncharacterized protein DUF1585/uncharacterized protein DUF1595
MMAGRRLSPGLRPALAAVAASLCVNMIAARAPGAQAATPVRSAARTPTPGVDARTALIREYCTTCHNDRGKAGGVSLAAFDAASVLSNRPVAEKMIRKLRAGMMPPPGARRPDEGAILAFVSAMEEAIDGAAARNPEPGWRPFQRLNRLEYARAVRDLLSVEIDASAFLPPDTISHGFDNVADAQTFSPALMEGYLRAASRVAALAVGDRDAQSSEAHYRVPKTASQSRRVDGAPFGTRGGVSVIHTFPADGDYVFRMDLHGNADGFLFGGPASGEQLDVSIDGARVALLDIDPGMAEVTTGLSLRTPPIHVGAGARRVSAAFVQRFEGPVNDLLAPIDHTLADTQIGVAYGITTLPHLKDLAIVGPQRVTGISDTSSRRRIFTCRPTAPAEEAACAARIVRRLASDAFRQPVGERDFERLIRFYADERKARDFEAGIGAAVEAILASPQFLFRMETKPAATRTMRTYAISDVELASRLSFFLWDSGPDATLRELAARNRLRAPGVLDAQIARMLADPRSDALATRFATQWLRLNDVEGMLPDAVQYPYYDQTLGANFVRETQLFFDSLVREDKSILDVLTADYTFVNDRIARHYGIPNVTGNQFRRVSVPDYRRGIFGHGSVLVLTSVADRTSPVMRGKWIMEVLLGSPPPPPPPNVPPLEETSAASAGRLLSVRERMEEHRRNPTCNSCHRMIDPLGLALENFDVTGKWRIKDNDVPVDASGVMYDGTRIDGPAGLRSAILKHKDIFLQTFTENLMTYALGRRVEYFDMPAVRAIVRNASRRNFAISAFVAGVVQSDAFQMGAAETTDPALPR